MNEIDLVIKHLTSAAAQRSSGKRLNSPVNVKHSTAGTNPLHSDLENQRSIFPSNLLFKKKLYLRYVNAFQWDRWEVELYVSQPASLCCCTNLECAF